MTRVPKPARPATIADLRHRFPGWTITHEVYDVVTAERRTGTTLRFVVGHDVAGLAAKLARIEAATRAEEANSSELHR
jgi:hypothetical protein